MNNLFSASVFVSIVLMSGSVLGQTVTPDSALQSAIEKNLTMKIAIEELRSADLLVEKEDARYIPVWSNEIGFEHGRNASLDATGINSNARNALFFSSGLVHTLPVGTQIQVGLRLGGTSSILPAIDPLDQVGIYNTSLSLSVVQPLLRGFGKDIGEATLMSAKVARTVSDAQKLSTTSVLVKGIVSAYWDLWLAQKNLGIQNESSKVIRRQLDDSEIKLEAGTVSPAQIISLRIEEATTKELVAAAQAEVRKSSIALSLLMGIDASESLQATVEPLQGESPTFDAAKKDAESSSYVLMQARSQVDLQKIQEGIATNTALPKLDAVGGLTFSGIGREVGDSLSSLGSFDDYLISVGLRLELPLSNRAQDAEAMRKTVAVSIAQTQYDQTKREIDSQIATFLNSLRNNQIRLELARQTSKLAAENVDAQSARFEIGRATTLQVIDSIRSQREAEFRVVQIRVSIAIQKLQLDHVTGTLLNQWKN